MYIHTYQSQRSKSGTSNFGFLPTPFGLGSGDTDSMARFPFPPGVDGFLASDTLGICFFFLTSPDRSFALFAASSSLDFCSAADWPKS
jgi:hypothetical protein